MATKRRRNNAWHYTIKRAGVLPRPMYLSFESEEEGDKYVAQLEALLKRAPEQFLKRMHELRSVQDALRVYLQTVEVSRSDQCSSRESMGTTS